MNSHHKSTKEYVFTSFTCLSVYSPVENKRFSATCYPYLEIDPLNDYVEEDQPIDRANDLEEIVLGRHTEQKITKSRRLGQERLPPHLVIVYRVVRFDRDFRLGYTGSTDRIIRTFQLLYPAFDRLVDRIDLTHGYLRWARDNSSKSYHRRNQRITEPQFLLRMPTLMYLRLSNRSRIVMG